MNISFERATEADAEVLVKVQIAAFHSDADYYPGVPLDGPPGYDSVETALRKIREEEYYKILLDGEVIGGIVVWPEADGHFHLDLLYIAPEHHARGIGSQAIAFIEQTYPATVWSLHTPGYATRNHHFYEKFGYINVGEEDHDGFTLIAYRKHL